jgi:hypothetical protein
MPAALLLIGDRTWGRRRHAERTTAPVAQPVVETEPVPAGVGSTVGELPLAEQSAR